MSGYPLGANEDKKAPWHEKETRYKTCPDCNGAGNFSDSTCCGASIIMGDICSECREHTEAERCSTCNGEGEIPMTEEELHDEAERLSDEG